MAKMAEFRELWECSGPVNQLVTQTELARPPQRDAPGCSGCVVPICHTIRQPEYVCNPRKGLALPNDIRREVDSVVVTTTTLD